MVSWTQTSSALNWQALATFSFHFSSLRERHAAHTFFIKAVRNCLSAILFAYSLGNKYNHIICKFRTAVGMPKLSYMCCSEVVCNIASAAQCFFLHTLWRVTVPSMRNGICKLLGYTKQCFYNNLTYMV